MRKILEQSLVALLNEDKDKADKLLHQFILERSRQIHESNRHGEEFVIDEDDDLDEGKTYKRNKDGDAYDRRKQDQQRRQERQEKRNIPVAEASEDGNTEFIASMGNLEIVLYKDDVLEIAQSGDNLPAVEAAMEKPYLKRQLADLDEDNVREELSQYGAWDDEELEDHEENLRRVVWNAAWTIFEDEEYRDQLEEGKTFKRGRDEDENEDVEDKKRQDKQRRQQQREKNNLPVEEGKTYKRGRDEDEDDDVDAKKRQDQQRRNAQKKKRDEPIEEGVLTVSQGDDGEVEITHTPDSSADQSDTPVDAVGSSFDAPEITDVDALDLDLDAALDSELDDEPRL